MRLSPGASLLGLGETTHTIVLLLLIWVLFSSYSQRC